METNPSQVEPDEKFRQPRVKMDSILCASRNFGASTTGADELVGEIRSALRHINSTVRAAITYSLHIL